MSLEGYDLTKPYWRMEILRAPPEVDQGLLEGSIVRLQYLDKMGKGKFPKFTIEMDNTTGRVWNQAMLAIGLRLKIRFGYPGLLSKPILALVTAVRAGALGQPARTDRPPLPNPYGVVVMEAKAYPWKLHSEVGAQDIQVAQGLPMSRAMKEIARAAGYPDTKITVQPGAGGNNTMGEEPKFDRTMMLDSETAMEFAGRMAAQQGYDFRADSKEFRWHRKGWKEKVVESIGYFHGPDLLKFSVEGNYAMAPMAVKATGYDPKNGRSGIAYIQEGGTTGAAFAGATASAKVGGAAGSAFAGSTASMDTGIDSETMRKFGKGRTGVELTGSGEVAGVIKYQPVRRKRKGIPKALYRKDAVTAISKKVLQSALKRAHAHRDRKWVIKMDLVGNPMVFPPGGLLLYNFGPMIDGVWYIREVEHIFDTAGATTRVGLRGKAPAKGSGCGMISAPVQNADGTVQGWIQIANKNCGLRPGKKKGKGKKVKLQTPAVKKLNSHKSMGTKG